MVGEHELFVADCVLAMMKLLNDNGVKGLD